MAIKKKKENCKYWHKGCNLPLRKNLLGDDVMAPPDTCKLDKGEDCRAYFPME